MNIFPAIDIYQGKAVRLLHGDYSQMTIYSDDPVAVAKSFKEAGAKFLHLVDLEGAKSGTAPNFDLISRIVKETGLFTQVGGGIRNEDVICNYLNAGISRVILGTIAVTDRDFTSNIVRKYKEKIAIGVDIKDGNVATHGWTEVSTEGAFSFCRELENIGVKTVICTDISKDGAMCGTNRELYKQMSEQFSFDIIASGGVTDMDDVRSLNSMNLYGAILGKAIYTGAINLAEAVSEAQV